MARDTIGKKAEDKIKDWIDRPEDGYSFDRIPDQMSGYFGSKNICDFICYKYPNVWYIESKATWDDRFDFCEITPTQFEGLMEKSEISHVNAVVIVLFASYKRAFMIPIQEIKKRIDSGHKSINIKKIDKWDIDFHEIETVPNNRKQLLDYTGELQTIYH